LKAGENGIAVCISALHLMLSGFPLFEGIPCMFSCIHLVKNFLIQNEGKAILFFI